MPDHPPTTPRPAPSRRRGWLWPAAVAGLALAVLAFRLPAEPEFPDEWAYLSQAYFLDLLDRTDSPLWLDYPAYDLPPLPKYAIGLALKVGGHRTPPPSAARLWYGDIKTRFGDYARLVAARWPTVLFGVLGCVGVYVIGLLAVDRRVGLLAAGLLLLDPLYRMLSRRAMSDVPSEALILAAAAAGLWGWRQLIEGRPRIGLGIAAVLAAGVLGGLAVLAKLNGGLALMILGAWAGLALVLPGVSWRRKTLVLAVTAGAGVLAYAVFVPLNPFLWAVPAAPVPAAVREIAQEGILARTERLIDHRASVSEMAQDQFPHDALDSPTEKVAAVLVQGFGRFGPLGMKRQVADIYDPGRLVAGFDSTRRYDGFQDLGAVLWLPIVGAGAVVLARNGRLQQRAGRAPTAWAVLVQALVTIATVTAFIPLAWDRYFLPIQAPACLLGAAALVWAVESWTGRPTAGREP